MRARVARNGRAIERVKKALENSEKEMAAVRGSLAGGNVRKEATKLLKGARREVEKMNKALARDLDRLQKDVTSAAKGKPASKAKPKAKKATRKASGTKRTAARKRRAK